MARTLFKQTDKELPFVIHERSSDNKSEYQLSIQTGDDYLWYAVFPKHANEVIVNSPNITKLFGKCSDKVRDVGWLDFHGKARGLGENDTETYDIVDSGYLRIGKQTDLYSELLFNGSRLTDRWILRSIPNVFDKSFLGDDANIFLFWKPRRQRSYNSTEYYEAICDCPVRDSSAKFGDISLANCEEIRSQMTGNVTFNPNLQTFSGIAAAEGTWIDLFGNKYILTAEYIKNLYNKQKALLASGQKTRLNTEHTGQNIDGEITDVQLYTKPLYHIKVKGIYKGHLDLSEKRYGLSYENMHKVVWNADFQAWIPFESTIDAIGVVRNPACKICWITNVSD